MIGTVPTIRQDLIPTNTPHDRRPQNKLDYEYVTVHNTANEKSTAANERSWLTNAGNNRQASWHYAVDQKEAVQAIPDNENAWHSGDGRNGPGNRKSISIEMCESGDWNKTYSNMVGLTAYLLHKKGLGIDRLKKHQDWNGKYCPRLLIPMWSTFVADVKATLASLKGGTKAPATPATPTKPKGDPIMKGTINTATLNVRSTYSTSGAIVDTVKKGDVVEIFAETAGFYQIGSNRWVGASYVDVQKKAEAPAAATPPASTPNVPAWKLEGIEYLNKQGLLDDIEGWTEKVNEPMPVWATTIILANIAKKLGGAK